MTLSSGQFDQLLLNVSWWV